MGPETDAKPNPLTFVYYGAPQRSPEWLETKRGKIGASRLEDWMAVSKAKASAGKPLKARLDYEKELMFERQFGASFQNYVNDAMQDGIDFEDFAARQYAKIYADITLAECGCWANEFMAVSPDRLVYPRNDDPNTKLDFGHYIGLIEIKIVRDNTFVEVLMSGVPPKHMKQIQAQLKATQAAWCDYVCVNFTTKKIVIIRVEPDTEFQEYMMEAIQEELVTEPFKLDVVHDIIGELPDWSRGEVNAISGAKIDHSNSTATADKKSSGGW